LPALRSRRTLAASDRNSDNVRITQQRIQEIETLTDTDTTVAEDAKLELQAALIEDMKSEQPGASKSISAGWGLLIVVLIPLVSLGLYSHLGSPQLVSGTLDTSSTSALTATPHDLDEMLIQLDEKLAREPGNREGWELAARTYMKLGNYEKAETAFEKLNSLIPGNPDFLVGWADATIMVTGKVYTPEAKQRIEAALSLDSKHVDALWIASLGSESLGNHDLALNYLNTLLPLVENDQNTASQVGVMIERNLEQAGTGNLVQKSDAVNPGSGKVISVDVSLDSSLESQLPGNAVVYVFAKAENGPAAPLAVSRHELRQLPLNTELTEQMAMLKDMTIASFEKIVVTARVSKSGSPAQQSGDVVSDSVLVTPETAGDPVKLVINRIVD